MYTRRWHTALIQHATCKKIYKIRKTLTTQKKRKKNATFVSLTYALSLLCDNSFSPPISLQPPLDFQNHEPMARDFSLSLSLSLSLTLIVSLSPYSEMRTTTVEAPTYCEIRQLEEVVAVEVCFIVLLFLSMLYDIKSTPDLNHSNSYLYLFYFLFYIYIYTHTHTYEEGYFDSKSNSIELLQITTIHFILI